MLVIVKSFLRDESGQGMVEYALILALVAMAAVIALGPLGSEILGLFNRVVSEF